MDSHNGLRAIEDILIEHGAIEPLEVLVKFYTDPSSTSKWSQASDLRKKLAKLFHPDHQGECDENVARRLRSIIELTEAMDETTFSADPIAAERVRNTIRVAEAIGHVQVITIPLNRNLNANEIIAFGVGRQTPTSFEISVDGKVIQFTVADGVLQSKYLNQTVGSINVEIIETNGGQRLLVLHNKGRDPKTIDFKLSNIDTAVTAPIEIPGGRFGVPVSRMGSTRTISVGDVGGGDDGDKRSGSTVEIDPTAPRRERPLGKDKSKEPVEKPFSEIFPTPEKLEDLSKREPAATKSGFVAKLAATMGFKSQETPVALTVNHGEVGGLLFDTGSLSRNITLTLDREILAINIINGIVSINAVPLSQGSFRRFGNLEVGLRVVPPPNNAGSGKSVLMIRHSKESKNKNPITVS